MITTNRLLLLLIVLISGISCKIGTSAYAKQSASKTAEMVTELQKSDATNVSGGYLICKVDGIPLKAAYPGTIILYVPAKKEVNIWGKTPTGIISITIDDVETTGTFTIKGNSKNGAGIMSGSKMYEVKKSGTLFTVTLESIDELTISNSNGAKAIRGTFQGKLMDQDGNMVEITEGKFSTQ
jgi:hypothetical protein